MTPPSADAVAPSARLVSVRRPVVGAILTDVHFWVPVVVLALGLGLLVYIS